MIMGSTFKSLGVPEDLVKGVEELGIHTPTPIQEQAIPYLINKGYDTLGQAQTGTGKTAAYGLPLLTRINPKVEGVQGLVVAPTRELAKQVGKDLFRYTKYAEQKMFVEVCCGGDKLQVQRERLKRPTQIVVGTPGRLAELVEMGALSLKVVQYLVMDEADEMLSMGFKKQLHQIIKWCQGRRSTWVFSATFPPAVDGLLRGAMSTDPKIIQVSSRNTVNRDIIHRYHLCEKEQKDDFIYEFLSRQDEDRGIIFCRTKAGATMLGKKLAQMDYEVDVITGELTQQERDKVIRGFRKGRSQFIIATDMVARGIDIEGLAFVLHHQLPDQNEYYTHRAGRTGRAGNKGVSLVLVDSRDKRRLKQLEKEINVYFDEY